MQSEHKSAFYASHAYPSNPALECMLDLAYSEVLSDSNNKKFIDTMSATVRTRSIEKPRTLDSTVMPASESHWQKYQGNSAAKLSIEPTNLKASSICL
jgi:hypothetical protein